MVQPQVGIADVTLRSLSRVVPVAHGSVGRILPVVERLDAAGFTLIDVWGDMPVAHCLSVWNESPWERLRAICARVENATAQMQLAGSCLVGTRPQAAWVVREFVAHAVDCGVRSFLVYEPLNDQGSLERWLVTCREAGAEVRLAVVHPGAAAGRDGETAALATKLAALEPEGICLKTGAALGPHTAPALVRRLRQAVSVPLEVDLDNAGGLAGLTAALCADAGADVIYASAAPAWLDPAAVPVAVVLNVLGEGGLCSGLNAQAVAEAAERFASLSSPGDFEILAALDLAADWPEALQIPAAVAHQLAVRLREQGALERLRAVVDETIAVRRDMGAEALVPPLAQVAGAQAVLNVLFGRRWQLVPDEMRAYLRGAYGSPPTPVSAEVLAAVLAGSEPAMEDGPPDTAEGPPAGSGAAGQDSVAGRPVTSLEDALLLQLAPREAEAFLDRRQSRFSLEGGDGTTGGGTDDLTAVDAWQDLGPERVRELVGILESSDVEELTVETAGIKVSLRKAGGPAIPASPAPAVPAITAPAEPEDPGSGHMVTASLVGTFYRGPSPDAPPYVVQGQRVEAGDVLCVLEAMKLLNEVIAEVSGTITAVLADDGAAVEYGQPLFVIEPD